MNKLTEEELKERSITFNPNMWIVSWMYCPGCKQYSHHKPYTESGSDPKVFPVCNECHCHYPKWRIK